MIAMYDNMTPALAETLNGKRIGLRASIANGGHLALVDRFEKHAPIDALINADENVIAYAAGSYAHMLSHEFTAADHSRTFSRDALIIDGDARSASLRYMNRLAWNCAIAAIARHSDRALTPVELERAETVETAPDAPVAPKGKKPAKKGKK